MSAGTLQGGGKMFAINKLTDTTKAIENKEKIADIALKLLEDLPFAEVKSVTDIAQFKPLITQIFDTGPPPHTTAKPPPPACLPGGGSATTKGRGGFLEGCGKLVGAGGRGGAADNTHTKHGGGGIVVRGALFLRPCARDDRLRQAAVDRLQEQAEAALPPDRDVDPHR